MGLKFRLKRNEEFVYLLSVNLIIGEKWKIIIWIINFWELWCHAIIISVAQATLSELRKIRDHRKNTQKSTQKGRNSQDCLSVAQQF